jgi:hypothetical protein
LAVLKLVDGFAPEPGELVVGAEVVDPPPQPARRATTPSMPPTTKTFGDARIGIPPSNRCWS